MPEHQLVIVSQHAERYAQRLQAARLPDLHITACVSSNEALAHCAQADILMGAPDRLSPLLAHCPALRWVQSSWAGVKPLLQNTRRDYELTGVKDVFGQPMAEYVLAWLLAFERGVLRRAHSRHWDEQADGSLFGKTIGIMGTGSIGSQVASACRALGLRTRGLNSNGRAVNNFETCFSVEELDRFSDGLDFLVTLLPDTPASDNLVDADLLARLGPAAVVINGGRANCIHMEALLAALASGQLGHAVLDVLPAEPLPASDPLWQVENLHITSHTAAVTVPEVIADLFCTNYRRFHGGQALLHRIDFDKGY